MTYFPDLSPYSYTRTPPEGEGEPVNVGWLDADHDHPRGDAPDGLLAALVARCDKRINRTRGVHFCDLCPRLTPDEYRARWNDLVVFRSEYGDVDVGNGEIHVPNGAGRVYLAPTLIVHYVGVHRYLPPREFVEAVLSGGG